MSKFAAGGPIDAQLETRLTAVFEAHGGAQANHLSAIRGGIEGLGQGAAAGQALGLDALTCEVAGR